MVGPSSSHTAGAARLGLMARRLFGEDPRAATITLHGSFAATGHGHATDRAILAGLLGLAPDDASLPRSRELAASAGLSFAFVNEDLGESIHPNTARIQLSSSAGSSPQAQDSFAMTGSSLGGGVIEISSMDGYSTSFRGDLDTLVCWHEDRRGFLSHITSIVACVDVNIASLRTTRTGRGTNALTVIETDGPLPDAALNLFAHIPWLARLRALPPLP